MSLLLQLEELHDLIIQAEVVCRIGLHIDHELFDRRDIQAYLSALSLIVEKAKRISSSIV